MFQHSSNELTQLAETVLSMAKARGADAAETDIGESIGLNVQVRLQEIEQIEHQQDKSLDITVYVGQSKGRASTSDFSPEALTSTVQAAIDIAAYTAADPYAGLADADLMATEFPDLDKYHEWHLNSEEAITLLKHCENAALSHDKRITNSEGASLQTSHHQYIYANSHGFLQHQNSTRHSISCSVVASSNEQMERDYWYDLSCDAADLDAPEIIGCTAAKRAVKRLGARSAATGHYPVIFDSTVSSGLIGHLVGGLSGGALYRKSSFLNDSLGKKIMPEYINLREEPHIPRALGSACFDNEGVATQPRFVIQQGVVQGYFLSSYSAKKLGMRSTGNAGGAHNLYLNTTHANQIDLLHKMGTGLLVTELMGQGVNMLTGDYSRGAAGFWVENGMIAYPVSGITIAGRLQDMFLNIEGVADDALRRSSNKIGSILISEMTIAGS